MTLSQRRKLAKVDAKSFVFDDCHKIFLCQDTKDEKLAMTRGWKRSDFRPFDRKEIERLFDSSCPLRAVWWFSDRPTVIEQGS